MQGRMPLISGLDIDEDRKRLYYAQGWWRNTTLCDEWAHRVEQSPHSTYIKDETSSYTYGQVDDAAERLSLWLFQQGVKNGDVVTFQMPKWAEFAIVYVACLKVGAVMYPVDVRGGHDSLSQALNFTNSVVYIGPTYYHKRNYELEFHAIAHEVPHLRGALFIDKERPSLPADWSLSQVLENGEALHAPCPAAADDVACILATSGSTGTPKRALLTHNNILFAEWSYLSVLNLTSNDIVWMPSPLNHATGFFHGLIATMLAGGSVVLQQHYRPDTAAELIRREGCTWSHGATPFIFDLLNHLDSSRTEVPTLRFFLCGGAPVPSDLIQHAWEHHILLCESYGSTESIPHTYVPLDKCLEWNGAFSGIPYEGIEVKVVDEHRREVALGVQGEECSRGPQVFVGYLNEPERTARVLDADGWFYSGDLCTIDSAGRIRINGRKKEIIIRGGENISATEVDEHLNGCPGIGAHATIGCPDERLGERICTFVVPTGIQTPTVADVTGWLAAQKIPKRIWPERIETIDALPLTPTGKIQRYKLIEELLRRLGASSHTADSRGN